MRRFLRVVAVAGLMVAGGRAQTIQGVDSGEEFIGPLASWKSVTEAPYGAKGDGTTDDTAAIQHALDDLRNSDVSKFSVLYFPAGTYRVTRTLVTHRGTDGGDYNGTSIVGEDPATTCLRYDGAPGGNLLELDFWFGTVSRLTLDGAGKADVGLLHSGSFSTFCEISDVVFRDMAVGLQLGVDKSAGQAEHEVERCTFDHCSEAGVKTENWNSLDIWAWYCLFEDCGAGLLNTMGNFHAVGSVFLRSTRADVHSDNLGTFSFVRNHSFGSRCFIDGWLGEQLFLQGNAICDTTEPVAIAPTGAYQILAVDNVIKSAPGQAGPVFQLYNHTAGFFIGNRYNVARPVQPAEGSAKDAPPPGTYAPGCRAIGEKFDPKLAAPQVVQLPATPPNRHRRVFEVAMGTGDDARAIQQAIDAAAREPVGSHPVVHLRFGQYRVGRGIAVPAGHDIEVIGDGAGQRGTVLTWTGPGSNGAAPRAAMITLRGPSRAILSDFVLQGDATMLEITRADQRGGRIFASQVTSGGERGEDQPPAIGIWVNGVEQSDVTLLCSGAGESKRGIVVTGGPSGAAHRSPAGTVLNIDSDGGECANGDFDVTNGGRLIVIAAYDEVEGRVDRVLDLRDAGRLTVVGSVLNANGTPDQPTFVIDGFRGRLSYLLNRTSLADYQHQGGIAPWWQVGGDGAGQDALVALSTFWANAKSVDAGYEWRDATQPRARAAFLLDDTQNRDRFGDVTNRGPGTEPDDDAIRAALADLRAIRIELPTSRPPGVTDVRLHRVLLRPLEGGIGAEFTREP